MDHHSHLERFLLDRPGLGYREALSQLELELASSSQASPSEAGEIFAHLAETPRRLGNLTASLDLFKKSYLFLNNAGETNRMCWCLWELEAR